MFELNLIKEKAQARQRRRVIFLSVMCIVLLSGLLSMFVGGLIYQEFTAVKNVDTDIASTRDMVQQKDTQISHEAPRLNRQRTALINAYEELFAVMNDRPSFTPILRDVYENRPIAEFWYNQISVLRPGSRGAGAQRTGEYEESESLMGTRSMLASGYVQILLSDVLTESDLESIAGRMDGVRRVAGEPEFQIQTASLDEARARADQSGMHRYALFQMSTSARPARSSGLMLGGRN